MGKGGFSKGAGKSQAPQARALINGPRQIGSVTEWKGAFGWIVPSKPISHPKARQNGKVYLAQEDVTEELDGVGCKVSFQLYADGNGLGAQDCKMAKNISSAPIPAKGGGKGKSKPAAKAHPAAAKPAPPKVAPTWAKGVSKGGAHVGHLGVQQPLFQKKPQVAGGFQKGVQKGGAVQNLAKGNGKGTAKGAAKGAPQGLTYAKGAAPNVAKGANGKAAGEGKGAAPNVAKGANGKAAGKGAEGKGPQPRQIIYDKPLKGTVKQWKGKFGWVKPHDTIDHPLATKHQGDLFLAQEDVEQEINGVGAVVRFMLYEDTRGLGAANVRPA